jgi:LPXTG-motif cell wall-anchored protein
MESMKHFGLVQTAACAALLFAALSPRAVRADGWDKKTLLTFSDSVQVPGATLPAGTYVFKLAESNADRYIVQIFNEQESHVYATALVIPDIHLTPADKTLVMFYEAPVGQPRPVKAWFYPGDNIGREFVYTKHEAELIAAAGKETVPSEQTYGTVASAQAQLAPAPVAEQPAPEQPAPVVTTPVEPTPAVAEPEPAPAPVTRSEEPTPQAVAPEPTPAPAPEPVTDQTPDQTTTLPSTGSEWPLAGLIGLSSLAGAFAVRAIRRA